MPSDTPFYFPIPFEFSVEDFYDLPDLIYDNQEYYENGNQYVLQYYENENHIDFQYYDNGNHIDFQYYDQNLYSVNVQYYDLFNSN